MKAASRRLRRWAKMTSKQKLADMEREDRRRRRRAYPELGDAGAVYQEPTSEVAAQPLYHERRAK